MYLLSSARPAKQPAASHQRPEPPVAIRAAAHSVAVQKNNNGVSGVMMTDPTPRKRDVFSNSTADMPAVAPVGIATRDP